VHAGTNLRLFLMVLAGMVALSLMASVVALRGPASVSRAAYGDPAIIVTVAQGCQEVRVR